MAEHQTQFNAAAAAPQYSGAGRPRLSLVTDEIKPRYTLDLDAIIACGHSALEAGDKIAERLDRMLALAGMCALVSTETTRRQSAQSEIDAISQDIDHNIIGHAQDLPNLLDGTTGAGLFSSDPSLQSTSSILDSLDLRLGGPVLTLLRRNDVSDPAAAEAMMLTLRNSMARLEAGLDHMAYQLRKLETHRRFIALRLDRRAVETETSPLERVALNQLDQTQPATPLSKVRYAKVFAA